jgi:hypothetical protein
MDRLLEKYQEGIAKVDFLLFVERTGTPTTLNLILIYTPVYLSA